MALACSEKYKGSIQVKTCLCLRTLIDWFGTLCRLEFPLLIWCFPWSFPRERRFHWEINKHSARRLFSVINSNDNSTTSHLVVKTILATRLSEHRTPALALTSMTEFVSDLCASTSLFFSLVSMPFYFDLMLMVVLHRLLLLINKTLSSSAQSEAKIAIYLYGLLDEQPGRPFIYGSPHISDSTSLSDLA